MKRLLPLFLILLTLVAVSCDNSTPKKTEPEVKKYTVTFDPDNGEKTTTVEVESGKTVSAPEKEPEKTDTLGFAEWLTADGSDFDFDETPVTKDMTFKAHYYQKMGDEQKAQANAMMIVSSLLFNAEKIDDVEEATWKQLFTYMSRFLAEEDGRAYFTPDNSTEKYYITYEEDDAEGTKYAFVDIDTDKPTATTFTGKSAPSTTVKDAYDSALMITGLKVTGYFKEGEVTGEEGAKTITAKASPAFSKKADIELPYAVIASTYVKSGENIVPSMLSLITKSVDGNKPVAYIQVNSTDGTKSYITQLLRIDTNYYKNTYKITPEA